MTMNDNFGILTKNVVNSIVRIPINNYIGLLTISIVKSNVRGPIQSSTTKKLTNQVLETEWTIALASRASAYLFATQTLKNHPSGHPKLFVRNFSKCKFQAYNWIFSTLYISHGTV